MPELELWMRVGQPLEPVLTDTERILDAWQSGGVRGLVVGRLAFLPDYPQPADDQAAPVPAPDLRQRAQTARPTCRPPPAPGNWGGMLTGRRRGRARRPTARRRGCVRCRPAMAR